MIDGIDRLDDPTRHPYTPGCGSFPNNCWACGKPEQDHRPDSKAQSDPNAHLGGVEKEL